MGLSMAYEVYMFLYSCLAGALVLLIYDIFSVASKKNECPLFVCNVCDGIFVVVACAVIFFINLTLHGGILRGYEFFGAVLGALIYKLTISRLVLFLLLKITAFLTSFFKIFFKIVLTPIRFMYKMLSRCMTLFMRPLSAIIKRVLNHISFKMHGYFKAAKSTVKKM